MNSSSVMCDVDRAGAEQVRRAPRRHRGNVRRERDDRRLDARQRSRGAPTECSCPRRPPRDRRSIDAPPSPHPRPARQARHQPRLGCWRDNVVGDTARQHADVDRRVSEHRIAGQLERLELREQPHEVQRRRADRDADTPSAPRVPRCGWSRDGALGPSASVLSVGSPLMSARLVAARARACTHSFGGVRAVVTTSLPPPRTTARLAASRSQPLRRARSSPRRCPSRRRRLGP